MELWKPIAGYEGKYEVSNQGRVRSLMDWHGNRSAAKWVTREKIMTPTDNGNGYKIVCLRQHDGTKRKNHYVHRLVAEAFLGYYGGNVINHKDHNRGNNRVDNLEWCTQLENIQKSRHLMRHRKSKPYSNTGEMYISKAKKGGYRVTIDGKHIGIFKTLDSAVMARDNALGGFGK